MARSVNKVTLIGIVGNDIELRALASGSSAVNVSLATDESYMDRNTGMKVDQTEWHRISAFGKLAEIIHQYVRKGSRIYIEGKLRTREWEKDGIKRYTTEIIANEMMMLDRASDNFSQQRGGQQPGMSPAPMHNTQNNFGGGYAASPQYQQPQQHPGTPQQLANQQPMQPQPAAPQQAQPAYGAPQQPVASAPQQPAPAQQSAPQQPAPIQQPQNNFNDSFDDDIPF